MINDFGIRKRELYDYKGKDKCVVIPYGVKKIKFGAFYANWNIQNVVIPDTVKSTGYGTFFGCKNLTSVTIPNTVAFLRDVSFKWCENLLSIDIPESVISIGNDVFYGCENLGNISIPNSVKEIGRNAFKRCYKLTANKPYYFKATDRNMQCKGFQYEIGKYYHTSNAELDHCGFHACKNPLDIFNHYFGRVGKDIRMFAVELNGIKDKSKDDSTVCGTDICFIKELSISELAQLASNEVNNDEKN